MINFDTKKFDMWSVDEIKNYLDDFIKVYEQRPIKDNKGGMLFSHMFYFYFILKKINPDFVIESGIFKGQSTWLIERTIPHAKIVSIDINLNQREYVSKKATYSSKDFRFLDLKDISSNTLIFLDDHINHLDRIIDADLLNIKHIVLEDNYPGDKGDFQTIKQVIENKSFKHNPGFLSLLNTNFKFSKVIFKKIFDKNYNSKEDIDLIDKRIRDGHKNQVFIENILKKISSYYEFPPLEIQKNFDRNTLIKEPLFKDVNILNKIKNYQDTYNFFTYIYLK